MARLAAGLAALTATAGLTSVDANAQSSAAPWQPTRHPQDDWLEQVPGQHRMFFDASSPLGAGDALAYSNNFMVASRMGYQLAEGDNALVICLRHWATPFAFSDAMWAKYGAVLVERSKFTDPKTGAAPVINVYLDGSYGMQLPNRGLTFTEAARRKVHFAVCDLSMRALAGVVAERRGGAADAILAEFHGALHANAHIVPAGIVAVNRAQERGYAIAHMG